LAASGSSLARPLAGAALFAAAAAIVWFGAWRARAEAGSLEATARLLASRLPSPILRRGLLPAYELGREMELLASVDFSTALARAHIGEVARSARSADLALALPDRLARRAAQAFLFTALLFLFAVALFGDTMTAARACSSSAARGRPPRPASPSRSPARSS